MRREERKKRGGEKAKRKSQDCCDTFKPTRDLFTATFTKHSPHVRESKTVLDSGFHFTHSGFQVLNSSLFSVKSLSFLPDSNPRIPDSTSTNFTDSGTWIFLTPRQTRKRPALVTDTFFASQGCPLTRASVVVQFPP